jgi:ABC-type oligopeptide transport system ATPase subunit
MTAPVREVKRVQIYLPVNTGNQLQRRFGWVKAMESIDFAIMPGETVGLIG